MKTLIAIFVGGVAGAVAMLFYAPRSGEETRAKIFGKASDFSGNTTETIKDKASQARSMASELKENAQVKAAELHDKITEAL